MSFLSVCFYVLANYRISLLFAFPLLCLVLALIMHRVTGRRWGYFFIPAAFTFGLVNVFIGAWANAAFLHWAGTHGSAVIVAKRDAGWLLNEQPVNIYDVLLRTADGKDVVTQFDTMSVSIWPASQSVLIPPLNEKFVAKYIPGFPRNIAVMSTESAYGKRWAMNQALVPVDRARRLHEASPGNRQFSEAYRHALQDFLTAYRPTLAADQLSQYEHAVRELDELLADTPCFYDSSAQQELTHVDACVHLAEDRPVLKASVLGDLRFDDDRNGLAAVHMGGAWFWVRRDGYAQKVLTFDNGADEFSHGFVRGPGEDGMVYYDSKLQPALKTPYAWVLPFDAGHALVCADCQASEPDANGHRGMIGKTWGIIDLAGNEVVPPELSLSEVLQQQERGRLH